MKKIKRGLLCILCILLIFPECQAQGERCRNMQEVFETVEQECRNLSDSFCIPYLSGLDNLIGNKRNLHTLLYSSGLQNWREVIDREHRKIYLTDIDYMAGFKILTLYLQGREEELSRTEKRILQEALTIRNRVLAKQLSGAETEKLIHDELCERITYTHSDYQEPGKDFTAQDNAEGALLAGKAECDGYSDAFYLIANLTGIPTRYIYGTSCNSQKNEESKHMWNAVRINGLWFHVDVTWDDLVSDHGEKIITYRYMNVGSEHVRQNHRWEESMLPFSPLSEYTYWDHFYFTGWNAGNDFRSAYYEKAGDGARYVKEQKKAGYKTAFVMLDGRNLDYKVLSDAMSRAGVKERWYIWTHPMGEYTCFSVLFIR